MAFVIACWPVAAQAETVRIGATGAALGALDWLAVAFREDQGTHAIEVVRPSVGSTGAILGVIRGEIGLGISSRPLKEAEKAQGAVQRELGRSPFVLATARETPSGLTLGQLADFYAGRATVWPGGGRVRVILRPANDSDTGQLKTLSPAMTAAVESAFERPGMAIAATDQEAADLIARVPGALGPTTLAIIRGENRPLRALALEGVAPSLRAAMDGSYPYVKTFHLILPARPGQAAVAFVDFLKSGLGRQVLRDAGFWVTLKEGE
ncbi:MAG: substrate-binding domain-containing protein [Magnetospirillum sp. WYHS-4]